MHIGLGQSYTVLYDSWDHSTANSNNTEVVVDVSLQQMGMLLI